MSTEVLTSLQCNERYPDDQVGHEVLCTSGTTTPCKGDSGSSLTCKTKSDSRWHLAGIVSSIGVCGSDELPAIYVNIQYMLNWIFNVINEN